MKKAVKKTGGEMLKRKKTEFQEILAIYSLLGKKTHIDKEDFDEIERIFAKNRKQKDPILELGKFNLTAYIEKKTAKKPKRVVKKKA